MYARTLQHRNPPSAMNVQLTAHRASLWQYILVTLRQVLVRRLINLRMCLPICTTVESQQTETYQTIGISTMDLKSIMDQTLQKSPEVRTHTTGSTPTNSLKLPMVRPMVSFITPTLISPISVSSDKKTTTAWDGKQETLLT